MEDLSDEQKLISTELDKLVVDLSDEQKLISTELDKLVVWWIY